MLRSSTFQVANAIRVPLRTTGSSQIYPVTSSILRPRFLSTVQSHFLPRHPAFLQTSLRSRQQSRSYAAAATLAVPDSSDNIDFSRLNGNGVNSEIYTRIMDDLLRELEKEGLPEVVLDWYKSTLDYNVPGGLINFIETITDIMSMIKRRPLTGEEYMKGAVAGWTHEMTTAYLLGIDDIMDGSAVRRGKPCWYKKPDVGLFAANDACMLTSAAYRLLKKYFKHEPYYVDLVEATQEFIWRTELGQCFDGITTQKEVDLSKFSTESQQITALWKGSHYMYTPIKMAMHMCGIPDTPTIPSLDPSKPPESLYDVAETIMVMMGEYYHVLNDYTDFADTPEHPGTDVINNKNSWCINVALKHATPEQRRILDEHYGRGECRGESDMKVRAVYEEIGMRERFAEYEEKMIGSMRKHMARIPESQQENTLTKEVFEKFLSKLQRLAYS